MRENISKKIIQINRKKDKNFSSYLVILLFCFIGIAIKLTIPSFGIIHSPADDQLFVEYSSHINSGNWLGDWGRYTLLKVPGYGIFLSLSKFLNFNPIILTYLIYLFGSVNLAKVITTEILKKPKYFSFLSFIFIFNPALYGTAGSQVYRTTLVQSLFPLICYLVLSFYSKYNSFGSKYLSKFFIHLVLIGTLFGVLKIVREDVIWIILPSALFVIYTSFVYLNDRNKFNKGLFKFAFSILVLFLTYSLPSVTIKYLNYEKYGVFLINDFSEGYFPKAINEMARVVPRESLQAYQIVQKDSRLQIYDVSKTARMLEPYLENVNGWKLIPCRQGFCDQLESRGWFIFEIRDAAIETGTIESALDFQKFFQNIYEDISDGCKSRTLNCSSPGIIAGIPSFDKLDKTEVIDNYAIILSQLIDFSSADPIRPIQDVNDEREKLWSNNVIGLVPLTIKPTYHSEKDWFGAWVHFIQKQYSTFASLFLPVLILPILSLFSNKGIRFTRENLTYTYFLAIIMMQVSIHAIMDAAVMENIGARYLIQSQQIVIVLYFLSGVIVIDKLTSYLKWGRHELKS